MDLKTILIGGIIATCSLPALCSAEMQFGNKTATFGAALELQGFYGEAPSWRPEGPEAAAVYFALVHGSIGTDSVRLSLGFSSGTECRRTGAIRPIDDLCIPQAKLSVRLYENTSVKVSGAAGSDYAPFGAATLGPGRANNPGPLTIAGLTMPFTTAGISTTIEARNSRWLLTIGATTWNGVLPSRDSGDPAGYLAFTVSPFSKRQGSVTVPDTDTIVSLAYLFLAGNHPLNPLHAADLSFVTNYRRLYAAGEIHAGSAGAGRDRWVCGSLNPGIWLYKGTASPLVAGIIEGCREDFEPGTRAAILGSLTHSGSTLAVGGIAKTLISLPSGTLLIPMLSVRHERSDDRAMNALILSLLFVQ